MLAAGTGIAPMLQVIQGIVANELDETFIHLVYSNQRYDDILMKDILDEMKAYWNFSVLYILTRVSLILSGFHVTSFRLSLWMKTIIFFCSSTCIFTFLYCFFFFLCGYCYIFNMQAFKEKQALAKLLLIKLFF